MSRLDASREPPDSQAYQRLYAERDKLERGLEQLDERLKPLDLNTVNLRSVERTIDSWADPIVLAPAPIIGDETVDAVRARIDKLKQQLAEVRKEPLSSAERRQRVKDWIAHRATTPSVNPQGDIVIPQTPPVRTRLTDAFLTVNVGDHQLPRCDGFISQSGDDVLGMLCALMPDAMLKTMTASLPDGIDSEDRHTRVTDLLAAILEAERVDVILAEKAAVTYRAATDVRALLGVA